MEADNTNDNMGVGLSGSNESLFKTVSDKDTANTEVLEISGKYNSVIIAKNLVVNINDFNRLNPGFDLTLSTGEPFSLRLPSDKMDLFVRNRYPILNECVQVLLSDVSPTKTVYTNSAKQKKKG
jgi:membrane-bound lytic murein transglycosylase D